MCLIYLLAPASPYAELLQREAHERQVRGGQRAERVDLLLRLPEARGLKPGMRKVAPVAPVWTGGGFNAL